jgi:hypothetical protein
MHFSNTARALAIAGGAFIFGTAAHADQTMQMGISVSAKNIAVDGNDIKLNGDVRIAATPDRRLTFQSEKNALLVKFSDNQNRTVTVTPFDVKSETLTLTPSGFVLADKRGNTVTVFTNGQLPEAVTVVMPAYDTAKPVPYAPTHQSTPPASNAPVSVTIVQTAPPPPPPDKKERYVDPVTDRGAVIP